MSAGSISSGVSAVIKVRNEVLSRRSCSILLLSSENCEMFAGLEPYAAVGGFINSCAMYILVPTMVALNESSRRRVGGRMFIGRVAWHWG